MNRRTSAAGRLATKIADACKMEIISSSPFHQIIEGKTKKAQCIKLRSKKPALDEKLMQAVPVDPILQDDKKD